MIKIKGLKISENTAAYYMFAAFYVALILVIRYRGWNRVTNFLFLSSTIVSLCWMAYTFHRFFKRMDKKAGVLYKNGKMTTKDNGGYEDKEAVNSGQIWVTLIHLGFMIWFIFFSS